MAFTTPTYRITCEATGGGISGKAVNIYHVTSGTTATLSDTQLANVLTDLKLIYTAFGTYTSVTWTVGSRILELLPDGSPPVIRNIVPLNQAGGVGTVQPPQLAAVISWKTPLAGPSFRGRTFLGPLTSTAITAGGLNSAFLSAMQPAAVAVISNMPAHANGGGLCVRSTTKELDTLITSSAINSKVDTLRKRA